MSVERARGRALPIGRVGVRFPAPATTHRLVRRQEAGILEPASRTTAAGVEPTQRSTPGSGEDRSQPR